MIEGQWGEGMFRIPTSPEGIAFQVFAYQDSGGGGGQISTRSNVFTIVA